MLCVACSLRSCFAGDSFTSSFNMLVDIAFSDLHVVCGLKDMFVVFKMCNFYSFKGSAGRSVKSNECGHDPFDTTIKRNCTSVFAVLLEGEYQP